MYLKTALAIGCSAVIAAAWAQSTGSLTVTGAEAGASKDGQIPAFSGVSRTPAGWTPGKLRADFSPFKSEKPLFSITADNVAQYADKLSPGQLALFKQIKGYRMDVYPTHRDCGYPAWIQENIKKNAGTAKLDSSGDHLHAAVLPGLPFPGAKTGQEAIWNYLSRYRGIGAEWSKLNTIVSPRPGSSDFIDVVSHQTLFFPWGKKGANPLQGDEPLFSIYFAYQSPAALAGQGLVQTFNFANSDSPTFYYFSGQRRVRRMPSYDYDAPQIGFENQYTVDEPWLFNGDIDRFNWKLVGAKEMYVPYNDFGMYDFQKSVSDVYKPDTVDPSVRRYELHRVYEVEATLKENMRHISQKKVLYLDEDTYLALAGEDYDAQGKLWKVKEGYPIPVWELGGTCDVEPFTQYNLTSGRYVADQGAAGMGSDIRYYEQSNDPHFTPDFYTAENLQAISER
ncbi:DUF1329 domain-containing protein [Paraburkholderia sp. CNPSo 3272]|uniref:DUF1329 domain-containing protein n=1 Tax=Paraburkholderia sp. CNPSo 3272 TaxID=2940931 RepID=UPI0020B87D1F|nr:DUF1329 domain-containing protein [Paraburkholderia sp. CNPSo 3272]MCP3727110.1 DUF1329 domain-containing protein [Paraburkholderia sp. CNPSo 3272]